MTVVRTAITRIWQVPASVAMTAPAPLRAPSQGMTPPVVGMARTYPVPSQGVASGTVRGRCLRKTDLGILMVAALRRAQCFIPRA